MNSEKLTDSKQDKIHMFDILNRDDSFLLNDCITERNVGIMKMALLISVLSIGLSLFKDKIIQSVIIVVLIISGAYFVHKYRRYNKEILKIKTDIFTDRKKYLDEML